MRKITALSLSVIGCLMAASNDIILAAEATSSTIQLSTGYTVTQTQTAAQTSQALIDSKNAALLTTQSTITTSSTATNLLIAALKADSAQAQNLNLLYGTSFKPTGPSTSSDMARLTEITTAIGYNQTAYLGLLKASASYYRSLQADPVKRKAFNLQYKTYLQATGSPTAADRKILMGVVKSWTTSTTTVSTPVTTTTSTTTLPATGTALFSSTSFWRTRLSTSPAIKSNSGTLVNNLIANTQLAGPWINTTKYSTPLYTVGATTPKVAVSIVQNGKVMNWTALHAAFQKGVPLPTNAIPAAGTDGTLTVWDKSTDTIYEFWQLKKDSTGKWTASWGGILKNASTSSGVMPIVKNLAGGNEYWGATASGLPAIGGTMLLSELKAGVIPHELAFSIPKVAPSFVWPANRTDGYSTTSAIPMGTRFFFPKSIVINPAWSPIIKMMVIAIRDYGMVLRDTAGTVTFYGEDPTPTGTNPYPNYYGGKPLWDVMKQFPWSQLKTLA